MSEQKQTEGVPVINIEGLSMMGGTPYDDRARALRLAASAMSDARALSSASQKLLRVAVNKHPVQLVIEFDPYSGEGLKIRTGLIDPVELPLSEGVLEALSQAATRLCELLEVAADARATEAQTLLRGASGDQG